MAVKTILKKFASSQSPLVVVLVFFIGIIGLLGGIAMLQARFDAPVRTVAVALDTETRAKIEGRIRGITDQIKRGDKQGASTHLMQYLSLGINFELLGEVALAEDAYLRAAAADDTNYIPHANLGTLYQGIARYDDAERAFQRAIERAPREYGLHIRLAELYRYHLKSAEKARAAYIEGLARTENHPNMMRSFAAYLEQIGETSEALLYFEALLKQNPQDDYLKQTISEIKKRK